MSLEFLLQELARKRKCLPAVADGVLFFDGHLGVCFFEFGIEYNRIIAKAVCAAWFARDHEATVYSSACADFFCSQIIDRNNCNELCTALTVGYVFHLFENLPVAVFVASRHKPRRSHSRTAIERVNLQSRIFGKRQQSRLVSHCHRLDDRISFKRHSRFIRLPVSRKPRHIFKTQHVKRYASQKRFHLLELPPITRRDEKFSHSNRRDN